MRSSLRPGVRAGLWSVVRRLRTCTVWRFLRLTLRWIRRSLRYAELWTLPLAISHSVSPVPPDQLGMRRRVRRGLLG